MNDIDLDRLSDDEMDAVLEHAFSRYFETSGLFGSLQTCAARIAELEAVGVDEVACMIDFGVPVEEVLSSLHTLDELRASTQDQRVSDEIDEHLAGPMGDVERHRMVVEGGRLS